MAKNTKQAAVVLAETQDLMQPEEPKQPITKVKIDKTSWLAHVEISDYDGFFRLLVNGKSLGVHLMENGQATMPIPALGAEYTIKVEKLTKAK